MKPGFFQLPSPQRPSANSGRRGIALVLVLSVLVLLTILVVGFLSRATTDRSSAAAYSDGGRTSLLADNAINIVQAQIDHASTRPDTAWASQPGMVRTFKQSGTLSQAYKLYSDADMVATSVDIAAATTALAAWGSSSAHFVDLNEPVEADGQREYPVIDPSALDKNSDGTSKVEGFDAPVTSTPIQSGANANRIPMPVRWLYVLEDGQVVAPTNTSGTTATIPGASSSGTSVNPIVGRIAFWTDDETCKLNINTASHGTFWDIPRAFTLDERDRMARFQPALREFQRYPGHPASTSLWPVLGYKVTDPKDFGAFAYQLAPRVQKGGSEGGIKFAGAQPVTLDTDRLYVSLDELLFSATNGIRAAQTGLDRSDIERAKFFLTARSNSPEISLFKLPRMAIWPINAGTKTPSTLDKLIARCATINGKPYYFQRSDPASPTADMRLALDSLANKGRNEKLYDYVNALLAKPFPGFGSASFVTKYTQPETNQITTSIFDYIRSSNLYSTAVGASAYTGPGSLETLATRAGQVTPLQIGNTKGFGRLPAISQAFFQLYVSGMRSGSSPTREVSASPTATYLLQTGSAPLYSGSFSAGSYKAMRDFLTTTGTSTPVDLLTSAVIYFDTFDPMLGYAKPRYKFDIDVSFSGGWQVNGKSLGFQDATLQINRDHFSLYNSKANNLQGTYYGRFFGGLLGPLWMMQNHSYLAGNSPNTSTGGLSKAYPLASQRVAIHLPFNLINEPGVLPAKITLPDSAIVNFGNVAFTGGIVTAKIKVDGTVVQTYTFDFTSFTKPAPRYTPLTYLPLATNITPDTNYDLVLKQLATSMDFRNRWAQQPNTHVQYAGLAAGTIIKGGANDYCDLWLIQNTDTMVALEPAAGDKRILAARPVLTTGTLGDADASFIPNKDYASTTIKIAADLRNDPWALDRRQRAINNATRTGRLLDITYGRNAMPDVPSRYSNGVKSFTDGNFWPDFDNGTLTNPDDAYVNRSDEGSVNTAIADTDLGTATGSRAFPWYGENSGNNDNALFFSPNKQMPSAGMFGSLPTGAVRNKPWQTLLFHPDPGNHPGAKSPEDHLFLDLFWMPVVEPYAISEPFSSNGKVNMNYQIIPFGGYIHRSTALRGVMQTQEIVSIPNSLAYSGVPAVGTIAAGYSGNRANTTVDDEYKKYAASDSAILLSSTSIRRKLNLSSTNGTLKAFEDVFALNQIFRSETQICSLPLVASDTMWSANFESSYWDSRRLTGDNSREMPYTQLLPRLTTRSNTYTVHYRVQSLKKNPGGNAALWTEGKDKVTAELRGSRTIERYLDPNDTRIPDYAAEFAANPSAQPQSLDVFYRWRTLYNRTFAP